MGKAGASYLPQTIHQVVLALIYTYLAKRLPQQGWHSMPSHNPF